MNRPIKGTTFAIAAVATLVVVCIVTSMYLNKNHQPQIDQRSYHAGYISAGPVLVEQGVAATVACQQALEAASLFQTPNWEPFNTPSFNSGCYAAIRAHGDPVRTANGDPVNAN